MLKLHNLKDVQILQGIAAVIVGLVLIVALANWLTREEPYLLGTNHVQPRVFSVELKRGDMACQRIEQVPNGTRVIQVTTDTRGKNIVPPALVVSDGDKPLSRSNGNAVGNGAVDFRVAESSWGKDVDVCLKNSGDTIKLSGVGDFYPNIAKKHTNKAILNGKNVDAQIAMMYFGDKKTTILSLYGEIAQRASVFRPVLMGSWLYLLLPFVTLAISITAIAILIRKPK